MASGSISLLNIENIIESFNKDLSQCNMAFSNIENDFMEIKDGNQVQKSDIKGALNDIHCDLLRNIAKINNSVLEEDFHIGNHIKQFNKYKKVLESFVKIFNETFIESKLYKEKFLENYKGLKNAKAHIRDNDSDNESDIDKDENVNDYPDNVSEASDGSGVPSNLTQNIPDYKFLYHRKSFIDKNVIICQGCQTNIETYTYISLEANSSSIPFHIKKSCLKSGGVFLENLRRAKCVVYKLLNTHDDLEELLACGFSFIKIVGHRHFKPIVSKRRAKNAQGPIDHVQHNSPNEKNLSYILNEEPFHYEKLTYGEKCKGCFNKILKNEMTLRHQERIPREKMDSCPLISQYYHTSKECLIKRGFTLTYLLSVQCKAILSVEDNLSQVTEVLIQYGFSNENITCITKENNEPGCFEIAPTHIRDNENDIDKYEIVVNDYPDNVSEASDVSSVPSIVTPNIPVYKFLYHRKSVTDKNVTTCQGCQTNIETETYISLETNSTSVPFHINKKCLKIGGALPENFSRTKCVVYKLLNTHKDLKELLSCGFYFNKIVGYRPQNPIYQKPPIKKTQRQIDHVQHNNPNYKSSLYLFNNEPFYYERLIKCEQCKGCNNQIVKNNMSLRHQEHVPKETGCMSPLISQYYHTSKECLLKRGFTLTYLSNIKCKAILSVEDNLSQVTKILIQYGFSNENITCKSKENNESRCFKIAPRNIEVPLMENIGKQKGHDKSSDLTLFIFNEEPFLYEKLIHTENCMGCNCIIQRNDMTLRHQERVPREKISSCPLISQYYHVNQECLLKRGFMLKYLSFIKCKAMLSGDDNLSRVTKILVNCGFSIKNIIYIRKEINESITFYGKSTQPTKTTSEYQFYIVYCSRLSTLCHGCGLNFVPDQPCFIYSLKPEQNSNAKYFHIKKTCLKNHFTKEQIMATSCITNNLVDVSPINIIDCGIVKIVTGSSSSSSKENVYRPPNERRSGTEITSRSKTKPAPQPIRHRQCVENHSILCCSCGQEIPRGLYSLKIPNRPLNQALIHLDPVCVAKLGLSPEDEANCELVLCEGVSPDGVPELSPTASGDSQSSGFLI